MNNKSKFDFWWLFPPVALYRGVKYLCNLAFGKFFGNIVNMGQKTKIGNMDLKKHPKVVSMFQKYDYRMKNFDPELTYNLFKVKANENVNLDSIEIKSKNNLSNDKHMLIFMGRGAIFEAQIDSLCSTAKIYNCNVVSFNYRGINKSTGAATRSMNLVGSGAKKSITLLGT